MPAGIGGRLKADQRELSPVDARSLLRPGSSASTRDRALEPGADLGSARLIGIVPDEHRAGQRVGADIGDAGEPAELSLDSGLAHRIAPEPRYPQPYPPRQVRKDDRGRPCMSRRYHP